MRKIIAMFTAILVLTVALGFTVGAQTDSTPEADATPDERLCATPLADIDGTPTDDATVIASPDGGSPVAVVPCGTPVGSPATSDEPASPGATTVALVMVDIAFEPVALTIPANTDVTLELTNEGILPHNYAMPSEGIQTEDLSSGATITITINLPPGTYDFICSVPGHADAGMVGVITVE